MARKESSGGTNQGFGEVVGIVLIALAVLFFAALFTYDLKDVPANTATPNQPPHNSIGMFGAWSASKLFFLFGAAAYLIPPLFLLFGVAQYVRALDFLTRRWLWSVPLMLCFMGELDLLYRRFQALDQVRQNVNAPSPGGLVGWALNSRYTFGVFGHIGASIVFITIYLISLLYLTNFQLFGWIGAMIHNLRHPEEKPFSADGLSEKELEKRAKELSKHAKKLQDEMDKQNLQTEKEAAKSKEKEKEEAGDPEKMVAEKSGLGADGLPVPEPTVRDLSVPQPRLVPPEALAKGTEPVSEAKPEPEPKRKSKSKNEPVLEGEVISAREITAATTEDILGRKSAAQPPEEEKPPFNVPEPEAEAAPVEDNPFAAPVA
ncbi:MAG TPA: DNA translocase FtsK 4TM domain-containing protein, partial [Verrucomicrobiae bacterium]|nr:DNA translocase FtsK 4TM domain-containing protein [Verrucomicrobiae bacterium]